LLSDIKIITSYLKTIKKYGEIYETH